MKALVLDAMGVIYCVGDDVRDLLIPFIEERGGAKDVTKIEALYHEASLGHVSAAQFWTSLDVDPRLEDEYLEGHRLSTGLIDLLKAVDSRSCEVWCLSNDISEWSKKLRVRFGLDKYFRGFVISGDVGARKPDPAIYARLLQLVESSPAEVVFVDDNPRNLDTAATFGLVTVLFAPDGAPDAGHRAVRSLAELLAILA